MILVPSSTKKKNLLSKLILKYIPVGFICKCGAKYTSVDGERKEKNDSDFVCFLSRMKFFFYLSREKKLKTGAA